MRMDMPSPCRLTDTNAEVRRCLPHHHRRQAVLLNCYVYEPDIVVVFDETIMDKHVNVGEGCHEGTILVLNTGSRR